MFLCYSYGWCPASCREGPSLSQGLLIPILQLTALPLSHAAGCCLHSTAPAPLQFPLTGAPLLPGDSWELVSRSRKTGRDSALGCWNIPTGYGRSSFTSFLLNCPNCRDQISFSHPMHTLIDHRITKSKNGLGLMFIQFQASCHGQGTPTTIPGCS